MNEQFFIEHEDEILRATHPAYNAFCREDEDE